jgi:replicative DNA helicase
MHQLRGQRGREREQQREPPVVAGRVPPHDLDAEAAVLSAVMLDRDALDRVLETLEPEHFYSEANRLILEACKSLSLEGQPIDVVTVGSWLRSREQLPRIGGAAYLGQLVDATPAVANVVSHAKTVKEKWRIRRVIAVCQKYAAQGYGDVGITQEFIDQAEQEIYDIARTPETSTVSPLKEVLTVAFRQISAAAERGNRITGIPTHFVDIDKRTGGLHPGDLVIVAARPGMGKTSFCLNVAANVAMPQPVELPGPNDAGYGGRVVEKAGWGVAFFSLEMPKEQIAMRLVCAEARVDVGKLRQGYLSQDDWARLTSAASVLSNLPLWVDDSPALNILELRAKVRRLQAELARQKLPDGDGIQGLGLVVVDYLQLMQGNKYVASREQEISEISRGLKGLAKELRVPVIALSQLNRGVETRATKDKRPMLADLRESGAIEQDADTIVFIYRDEYYNRETTDQKGLAELIIAKQRNGPTGTVRVRFVSSCTRFENLAPGEYEGYDGGDEYGG